MLVYSIATSRHHCLAIEEIQSVVFEYVALDTSTGQRTLLSVALSCKVFLGPSLDVLWRTQASLVPLLKCMPSDLWEEVRSGLNIKRFVSRIHGRFCSHRALSP